MKLHRKPQTTDLQAPKAWPQPLVISLPSGESIRYLSQGSPNALVWSMLR